MYFRLTSNGKIIDVDNHDNRITISVLFNSKTTVESSMRYDIALINQINKVFSEEWFPNRLFPIYSQINDTGVDKFEVLDDNDHVLMTFPKMNVSYRMTNSNISADRLSDTNDRPQERLEFTFSNETSVFDIVV